MAESGPGTGPPATRGPFAARLALKLVDNMLGGVCARVVKALVDRGTQQYGELVRGAGLPAGQLRAALIVLIQHNYVNSYLKEEPPTLRGPGPCYTLYEACLPRILQSLRMPRFLNFTAEHHGEDSARLVRALLEHGRLRSDQLVQVTRSLAESDGDEAPKQDVLLNQFRSLVIERLVERAPPCNLPPPAQNVHPNVKKKKATQPKPGSEEELQMLREQEDAQKRQAYQEVRFKLPDDLTGGPGGSGRSDGKAAGKRKRGKDAEAAAEEPAKKKKGKKGADAKPLEEVKAEPEAAPELAAGDSEGSAPPVLWRVNYTEFNRRFRNAVIEASVKKKYGSAAGQAIKGMLLANAQFEQSPYTLETAILGVQVIRSALQRVEEGEDAVPEADVVEDMLALIASDNLGTVEEHGTGPGGTQFVLNVPKLLNFARFYELLAVIRNKFGQTGMRIWHMLVQKGQLEQKQVADLAMVTKEEAREKLYAMLKAGYVGLQDVPRTADHAPSRTFYTWRAHVDGCIARVASDLYRAAGNLHARMKHEVDKKQELLDMVSSTASIPSHVREQREDEIEGLKAVNARLEAALLELDEQIMLFCDV